MALASRKGLRAGCEPSRRGRVGPASGLFQKTACHGRRVSGRCDVIGWAHLAEEGSGLPEHQELWLRLSPGVGACGWTKLGTQSTVSLTTVLGAQQLCAFWEGELSGPPIPTAKVAPDRGTDSHKV